MLSLCAALLLAFSTPAVQAAPAAPPVSGDAGAEVVSAFVFRGIVYEDEGLLLQPYANLRLQLRDGPTLQNLRLSLGYWASVNSVQTDASQMPRALYEIDVVPALLVDLPAGLSSELRYTAFLSPNGGFDGAHELGLYLRHRAATGPLRWKTELLVAGPTVTEGARYTYGHLQVRAAHGAWSEGDRYVDLFAPLRLGANLRGEDEVGQVGAQPRYLQLGLGGAYGRDGGSQGMEAYVQADAIRAADPLVVALGQPALQPVFTLGFATWY